MPPFSEIPPELLLLIGQHCWAERQFVSKALPSARTHGVIFKVLVPTIRPLHNLTLVSRRFSKILTPLLSHQAGLHHPLFPIESYIHRLSALGRLSLIENILLRNSFLLHHLNSHEPIEPNYRRPVFLAALNSHHEVVKYLLLHGDTPLPLSPPRPGLNAVSYAIAGGSEEIVKTLLTLYGGYKDEWDLGTLSQSPLFAAFATGRLDFATLLWQAGAGADPLDQMRQTPLHWVAEARCKFDSEAKKGYGYSPKYSEQAVKMLLARGANPFLRNVRGHTPLRVAMIHGNIPVIKALISLDESLDDISNGRRRTIDVNRPAAMTLGDDRRLVGGGVDTNETALHVAVRLHPPPTVASEHGQRVYKTILFTLVVCGRASVNAQSRRGYTPLHIASRELDPSAVLTLIQLGANLRLTTRKGKTALHCVVDGMADILSQSPGRPPQILQCASEVIAVLGRRLREEDFNTLAGEWGTPLHIAVRRKCWEVIVPLVRFGADPDTKDEDGASAMDVAVESGGAGPLLEMLTGVTRNCERGPRRDWDMVEVLEEDRMLRGWGDEDGR